MNRSMKTLTTWGVVCSCALAALTACADAPQPEQLYKRLLPSVMTLTVQKADGSTATGTGFLAVKEGLAVTAWHVVRNAKSVTAKFSDGEEFEVPGLVDKDETRDVALIRVKEFGRPLLTLATAAPEVGAKAYAVGAPEGLEFSLSDGLISQTRKDGGVTFYQFSCPTSPGNSGGPLAEADGEVIGIVSRQMRDGQNLNFAMPSTYALALDATLPARAWADMKPEAPKGEVAQEAPSRAVDNGPLDKRLTDCFATLRDTQTALQVMDGILSKDKGDGSISGAPPFLYTLRDDLTTEVVQLYFMRSADPEREKARADVETRVGAALDTVGLLIKAIRTAQAEGGWYGSPNDLLAQSAARMPKFIAPYPAEVKALVQSAGFGAGVSQADTLGLLADTADFRLGASAWVHSPLELAAVAKGSLADKMGLRAGDTLLSVGDQAPKSLLDLKATITANLGGRLKLAVLRGGKRKEWAAKVPRDLP